RPTSSAVRTPSRPWSPRARRSPPRSAEPAGTIRRARRPCGRRGGSFRCPLHHLPLLTPHQFIERLSRLMTSTQAPAHRTRSASVPAVVTRIAVLGITLAVAVFIAPVLIAQESWMWLAVLVISAVSIFVLYATKRFEIGRAS